jgi:hypothetical protein
MVRARITEKLGGVVFSLFPPPTRRKTEMSVAIKGLNGAIRLEVTVDSNPTVVVAQTTTQHPTFSALKADLQAKVDAYNAAQQPAAAAGTEADQALNS